MNDKERANWINNEEGLYVWWKRSKQSMRSFIKTNRHYIDAAINSILNKNPSK